MYFNFFRYLKLLNAGMASENAMLHRRNDIIDDNIVGEMVNMVHSCDDANGTNGLITKPTPMVHTRSLKSLISRHLDAHEK